jgi:hypothetical protein
MTVPSADRRGTDRHYRWSRAGDDGGCPVRRHPLPFERHSHDNRTCQGNPLPPTRQIGSPADSPWLCQLQSSDLPSLKSP